MFDFTGFGKRDPRKTPAFLFSGTLHLDYATAVRADISKQNCSICPRYWYIAATFRCRRCNEPFPFTVDEQRFWYEELCFWIDSLPRECGDCRSKLRELKSLRQEYDRELAAAITGEATLEKKHRLVEVINRLDEATIQLPEKTLDNRRLLLSQIEKLSR